MIPLFCFSPTISSPYLKISAIKGWEVKMKWKHNELQTKTPHIWPIPFWKQDPCFSIFWNLGKPMTRGFLIRKHSKRQWNNGPWSFCFRLVYNCAKHQQWRLSWRHLVFFTAPARSARPQSLVCLYLLASHIITIINWIHCDGGQRTKIAFISTFRSSFPL